MMDLADRELSEPIEIWKAAMGDTSDLVALLRSDDALTKWQRDDLALLLEGRLIGPTRGGRGAPKKKRRLTDFLYDPTYLAVCHYRKIAKGRSKNKRIYGTSETLKTKIANRHGINLETLRNALQRGPEYRPKKRSQTDLEKFRSWYYSSVRKK